MKTTGVSDIPKFGLLGFLGHPTVHVLQLGTIKQGFLLNISVKILDLTLVLICILQILKVKWSLNHTYGR